MKPENEYNERQEQQKTPETQERMSLKNKKIKHDNMAINQLNKYVWLVETIHRAKKRFPDFKTSLTKFFLEFGKVKALHLLQYAVHGFLDFRFVDFANVLRLYKVPFLGYGIGVLQFQIHIQERAVRQQEPEAPY